ncbi:MAG: hypothetical protein H6753_06420 [Candidatus Omnitrophica bacterium]|nr:hypothetical protein [Candidatus Omnitrophota bacterium]
MIKSLLRIARSSIGLGVIVLVVGLGYAHFIKSVKTDRYQIFNFGKTITWAQSQNSLYRTHTHGTTDNLILSEDDWTEYVFSMQIINAQDCGFVYDYLDSNNYYFVYFKKETGSIVSGQLVDNKVQNLKSAVFAFPLSFDVIVKKQKGLVSVIVNQQLFFETQTTTLAGKIGLTLSGLKAPPAIFHQVAIKGVLGNGQKLEADIRAKPKSGIVQAFKSFLFFYLAFILLIIFGPLFVVQMKFRKIVFPARIDKFLRISNPLLVHLFLAGCFFWPFVARGEVAVFSYDNLGEILPLFYYAQQNFLNILQGNAAWLWNPLIQNGFPFYSNHWDMIYYPLNWPVFLFPQAHLLTALTFKTFIEVVALGIFAYGFFVIELQNKRWALFSSVVYQMCSLLIFTMGIFPATSAYFAMTFYLYVLWSVAQRRALYNFLLMTFAIVLILTSANVAFIFYACLALAVISIYRFLSVRPIELKVFVLTALAWMTGTLMSSVRILSCLAGVTSSNRMVESFHTLHDRVYMLVRLFIPEIAGWMGPDALNVLMSPNLRLIFSELELPSSNPQNSFFVYFGVIPALLLAGSFLFSVKGKHAFWKVYSFVVLGIALLWQPIWGILSILCLPLNHYSYHAIILPIGICSLIGYTGMVWEAGAFENKDLQRNLTVFLILAGAYIFVFLTYLFPSLAFLMRIIFLIIAFGIAVYYALRHRSISLSDKFISFLNYLGNVLMLALLILTTLFLVLAPIPKKEGLGTELILPFLWLSAVAVMILSFYQDYQTHSDFKKFVRGLWISLMTALLFSATWVFYDKGNFLLGWESSLRVYAIDVLVGFLRFFLLLQIGLLSFRALGKKLLSIRLVFMLLLIFTAMDLIVFNARFNNITSPFYFKNAFYPQPFSYRAINPNLRAQMDFVNYRVSHQDRQDINANKNLIFNMPSYTGTVGYMTQRFSKFLTAFGYVQGIYMLYPEDATDNSRFLDLSAVRYVFEGNGKISERSSALGRLNFLFSAEVIADDDILLARLKEESFDPHKTVLLSKSTSLNVASPKEGMMIPIDHASPNVIESHLRAPAVGLLLFNESYDAGWKVYLNGILTPILRANYNFMACVIAQAGDYDVRFIYDPPEYKRNLYISFLGLGIFLLATAIAIMQKISLLIRKK